MNDMTPIPDLVAEAYGCTTFVYLDIETIPTQDAEIIAEIRKGVKPPASMSKPETIEKWWAENGVAAGDDAVAKTSFDGGRGHICTIAWAMNGSSVAHSHADRVEGEREILTDFFASLPSYKSVCIVGHYVAGFDLPFLIKRAVCLGVPIPHAIPRDTKPWGDRIHDTMHMWAGAKDTISLDNLCRVLGVPGKGGFDGSQVAQAWADGRHDEIAEYCRGDVDRTRAVHQRFLAAGW
jgi:DNA polymerase elongation subunit (family B)